MRFPVEGRITARWNEMRPLSVEPRFRTHYHGAIDIAAQVGEPIFAPENGLLYVLCLTRPDSNKTWKELQWRDGESFPFQNYFYDVYGSLILLIGQTSCLWHLFCHSWWNQIFNKNVVDKLTFEYYEEKKVKNFPIVSYHNLSCPAFIKEGEIIGYIGNAGFSTGPHAHYEIHEAKFQDYKDRPDPEKVFGLR